jgi:hypothetical protein
LLVPKSFIYLHPEKETKFFKILNDSVAQLVEQYTFNVWALGSNPSGITLFIRKNNQSLVKHSFYKAFFIYLYQTKSKGKMKVKQNL